MQIAAAIRKLRELTGQSQQAFSTELGISISALANYELRGRTPPLATLAKLQEVSREQENTPVAIKKCIDDAFEQELPKALGSSKNLVAFNFSADGKGGLRGAGLSFQVLNTPKEYALMLTAQHALRQLREHDPSAEVAVQGFLDALKPSMSKGDAIQLAKLLKGDK